MTDFSHRGFLVSVFVRRSSGTWEVTTTIYAPRALVDELGDQVTMDVSRSPTNRIEQVRTEAFEQAKKFINDLVARRSAMSSPAR
ncbi:MAG: hypothetical protein ACM338_12625 [Betaproteobacteria bacterium]